MKISLLRLWVIWRRFRRGSRHQHEHHLEYSAQLDALMRRANPFAFWGDRANWMIDVAEWLRRVPKPAAGDENMWRRVRHQRVRFLLDWLESHRDVKRVVQATLQKTLREAVGPELFCATGLPREPAFFSELWERVVKKFLPKPPGQRDLSSLFTAMFPEPADADWLLGLDQKTLARVWRLCADDNIAHNYRKQIDEALIYLVTMVISIGVSPDFRERLEPKMPLQATPFMALRRELEKYLLTPTHDEVALRSVRMLIAVCQAQTDRIYAHLDEYGVSVSLVYRIERMRAQLMRMARLIDMRSAPNSPQAANETGHVQALLGDLINAHHHRGSVRGLARRSFSLLARKMVERNADHGEPYAVRGRGDYRAMLRAACVGGVLVSFALLGKFALSGIGLASFFEGLSVSLGYVATFLVISALGGILAARQPAVTAPALASKMQSLQTADGLRALLLETRRLLRAQSVGVLGNLLAVIPIMTAVTLAVLALSGAPMINSADAHASLKSLSLLGPAPLYAALTGVLLWLSGLSAGLADNWFALRRLREGLAHQRRLVHALGAARSERWSRWLEAHVAIIVGNVSLGILLGMTPAVAGFFGLPLEVRHVTLAAGTLAAAASSLGWGVLQTADFWLALGGIASFAVLNVGVAFACALTLALRARDVPRRLRRVVLRAVFRRLASSPRSFVLPEKHTATVVPLPSANSPASEREKKRSGGKR